MEKKIVIICWWLTLQCGFTHGAGPCDISNYRGFPKAGQLWHCSEQTEHGKVVAVTGFFNPVIVYEGYTIHIENGHLTTVACPEGTFNNEIIISDQINKCRPHVACDRLGDHLIQIGPAKKNSVLDCGCQEGYKSEFPGSICNEIDSNPHSCSCVSDICPAGNGVQGNNQNDCIECPLGQFNDGTFKTCKAWTICKENEVEVAGSKINDHKCLSSENSIEIFPGTFPPAFPTVSTTTGVPHSNTTIEVPTSTVNTTGLPKGKNETSVPGNKNTGSKKSYDTMAIFEIVKAAVVFNTFLLLFCCGSK